MEDGLRPLGGARHHSVLDSLRLEPGQRGGREQGEQDAEDSAMAVATEASMVTGVRNRGCRYDAAAINTMNTMPRTSEPGRGRGRAARWFVESRAGHVRRVAEARTLSAGRTSSIRTKPTGPTLPGRRSGPASADQTTIAGSRAS